MIFTREHRLDWIDGQAHYQYTGPTMIQFEREDLGWNRNNFWLLMWLTMLRKDFGGGEIEDIKWSLGLIKAIRNKIKNWS